jgi:hypothetical protein
MNLNFKLITVSLIIATMYSCSPYKEILPGYKLYDSPNSIDKPGKVYRLSSDGKTDFVVEFLNINVEPQTIIIKEKEQLKKTNINAIISFISKKGSIGADLDLNYEKEISFKFKLGGTKIYKVTDENLRPLQSDLIKRLKADIKLFGFNKPKYFIVREAITAKEILIKIEKHTQSNDSIIAKINQIVNVDSNVKWTNEKKTEIRVSQNEGLFIFFKPEEINFQSSITGNGDPEIYFSKVDSVDLDRLKIGIIQNKQ